jgi:CheY-like chemotaxis protein
MASIVVVEDNPQTARMVVKLLRLQGHTVNALETGEEGLLKIMQDMPNLILIDLGLPDIDGQTVIAIIRQQLDLTATPIVAFTAWPPATARQMAIAYGCDGVITKPIDTRTFPQQIEAFLRQPILDGENEASGGPQPQK